MRVMPTLALRFEVKRDLNEATMWWWESKEQGAAEAGVVLLLRATWRSQAHTEKTRWLLPLKSQTTHTSSSRSPSVMDRTFLKGVKALDRVPIGELLQGMTTNVVESMETLGGSNVRPPLARDEVAPPPSHYATMAGEIHGELIIVLQDMQGIVPLLRQALSMAPPPTSRRPGMAASPLAGLNDKAIVCIKTLLHRMCYVIVAQLLSLARKAMGEAQVWRRAAVYTSRKAERKCLDAAITALRGQAPSREETDENGNKVEKVLGAGVGRDFGLSIGNSVHEVFKALCRVCTSCMDARAQPIISRAINQSTPINASSTPAEARRYAMESIAMLSAACIDIMSKAPCDGKGAITQKWKQRQDKMDALGLKFRGEVGKEACAAASSPRARTSAAIGKSAAVSLTRAERARAKRFLPLIELGCQLHQAAGRAAVLPAEEGAAWIIDLDVTDLQAERQHATYSELVSQLLYGVGTSGTDDKMELSWDCDLFIEASISLAQTVGINVAVESQEWLDEAVVLLSKAESLKVPNPARQEVAKLTRSFVAHGLRLTLQLPQWDP